MHTLDTNYFVTRVCITVPVEALCNREVIFVRYAYVEQYELVVKSWVSVERRMHNHEEWQSVTAGDMHTLVQM